MYLIDGHNLIPKIPGWSLRHVDDEQELITLLQRYCAERRRDVEVFFDKAPVGFSGTHSYGRVKAHFVRQGTTADDAIRRRLESLGNQARNVSVVSSDRQVQSEARSRQATVIPSETFAAELTPLLPPPDQDQKGRPKPRKRKDAGNTQLSQDEIDEWLRLFGADES